MEILKICKPRTHNLKQETRNPKQETRNPKLRTYKMKIAIASGKGGTGKTTVSVNLLQSIHQHWTTDVQLVDCDVEEPNAALFFPEKEIAEEKEIAQPIPKIDIEKCTFCRNCVEFCEFNAIVVIPNVEFAEVNASLCHSCGACTVACSFGAIEEKPQPIGKMNTYGLPKGISLYEGNLKIGSAMQTYLIGELKKNVPSDCNLTLLDSPPGTSCPVVETVSDVDYVILVAEPTPFGLHDLTLMVDLLRAIKKDFGVVVNKAGKGNSQLYEYLSNENIELLAEIPFSKEYAACYANGEILKDIPEPISKTYRELAKKLQNKLQPCKK